MLKTVLKNFFQPGRTRKPHDLPPVPHEFRGVIAHNKALCTGCETCAYVCAPKAITFTDGADKSVSWHFFAGKCSFCGLCQAYCPTKAISNPNALPAVGGDQAAYRFESVMTQTICRRCGAPHIPLPAGSVPNISDEDLGLCWECRRKLASERIRDAFQAKTAAASKEERHDER